MNGLQTGAFSIGSNPDGNNRSTAFVPFSGEYASTENLIVLATPLQDSNIPPNIPDCFAVTVTSIGVSGFTVNIARVDGLGKGWGQNLQIAWMAFYTTGN